MESLKPSVLEQQAVGALQQAAYSPKKLVLLHTSVALGVPMLVTFLNYLLSLQIADTGGLSGLGLRSVLSTIQSVLEFAQLVALPFWEIGLVFAALCWLKKEAAQPNSLLQGFRSFGKVLGMQLLQGCLLFLLGFAIMYICIIVFVMTPFAQPLIELLKPFMQPSLTPDQLETMLTQDVLLAMADAMTPLLIIFGVLFIIVMAVLFFRMRFAEFSVMEGVGPLQSILQSFRMTRRNCLALLKVDLHFWWFYLGLGLCIALSFGDQLLPLLGIALPFAEQVSFLVFYVLSALAQWLLYVLSRERILTTYAAAYQALQQAGYR